MSTTIFIRPFEAADAEYASIGRIGYANFPDVHHFSAPANREWDRQFQYAPQCKHQRYLALDRETKQIVGYSSYSQEPSEFHPQKFQVEILVDAPWQQRGIGTQLWEHMQAELKKHNALVARIETRQDKSASVAFLQKEGFMERLRYWDSILNLETFDLAPFSTYGERMKQLGIELTTLAREGAKNQAILHTLHQFHITVRQDVPQAEPYAPQSYALFEQRLILSPRALHEGYFIAKKDGAFIGESFLFKVLDNPNALGQGLTAVRRDFRNHGIAMALKLEAIRYAQQMGYKSIKTRNESNNHGMLAINQKLGFVREPAWILFEKSL
jgi:GNAT superfamily N-acetyltransferase